MKFLSETKASVIFLAAMAVILGAATFVERWAGTAVALAIYHNPGTIALWILLTLNWLFIWRKLLKSKKIPLGSTILHLSFAVMLCGAFVTMVSETEGRMHLESGEAKGMILKDNGHPAGLPFTMGLDSLEISRYPGTGNPSGFTSYVTVTKAGMSHKETISVNHPLRIDGWRIYQSSYVPETGGSIFSLAHDPWGSTISYAGYALLLLAFLLLMFSPDSRFSRLRKQLAALGSVVLLLAVGTTQAEAAGNVSWDNVAAQDSRGRIVTLDSYCRELLRKIHHDEQWDGRDAITSVLSLMTDPGAACDIPLIHQKNKDIAAMIGQGEGKLASFSSLIGEDGSYKIADLVRQALSVPSQQRSKLQKDILKLDEKANLFYALIQGQELPIFPESNSGGAVWHSPADCHSPMPPEDSTFMSNMVPLIFAGCTQQTADELARYQAERAAEVLPSAGQARQEILCNRLRPFKTGAMGYMFCALLLMVCSLMLRKGSGFRKLSCIVVLALSGLVFLLHTWGIAARWYCSGQPPLSNSYEITVFLSWCIAILSLILSRRSSAASAFGLFFSGALLLVAGMNNMDPAITPLVPVLQSPWLMFHVAVIIAGYGCFGINFLLSVYGLGALAVSGQDSTASRRTTILAEIFALVGLMLMTLGTFLGAVWAGESWGSYWSWDPKETWALITVLVYAICTHARLVPKLNMPKWLYILSIIGFLCILMTYFGVNYFLVGMHSYAR